MGGNSKRKARRRLERLRAEWDIIATKCLLLTPDGHRLYDYAKADKVLTTIFNRPSSAGDRNRLFEALHRAGIRAIPFTERYSSASRTLWGGKPGNFQNLPREDHLWTNESGSTSDSASESSTSSDTSTPSALGSPSLPDGNSRSAVKVGGF